MKKDGAWFLSTTDEAERYFVPFETQPQNEIEAERWAKNIEPKPNYFLSGFTLYEQRKTFVI